MVVMFSWRRVIKRSKLYIRIVLLTLIIFYILPKLMTMLWEFSNPGLKIRDQHLLEKPLRVMTEAKTAVSLQYDID
ncbi:hypothetical protein [Sporomusa sphaeroides]|uniref:Uncharacterized protein n=2 Tax=Sporomusa TaxID=2375 RepID=A0ABM9VXJ1_9FIRM|nr:hypothetical protein [Sporomusa sphaeroides]OLS58286.1 hypothetical protein SPSPH_18220 [Sporomusa sphaeroides DSM 2875]CVK17527.1 hypothetical protein SSPH_00161 [Sporomusa sphaeroides DSM 2875]SCM80355.1 conserved hypothetical protein [uncultured Sporomusa sp.]